MANKIIRVPPGVNTTATATANAGGNVASNLIRFFQGFVQRIGGWLRLFEGPCANYVRAMHPWTDLDLNKNLLMGTDSGPQILVNDTLYNFTLLRRSANLTPPWLSTVSGSPVVTVTDVANGSTPGDLIRLPMRVSGAAAGFIPGAFGSTPVIFGIASNGTTAVAVAAGGVIKTSADAGLTWTSRTSGVATDLLGVCWDGTQFVAVGASGVILTSPTGVTWTSQTSGVGTSLNAVAWSGSLLCAVGAGGVILTSPTGVVWTSRVSGTGNTLNRIAWASTQFVVVGDGGVIDTSPTGVTWTLQTSGTSSNLLGVASNGSTIVVAGFGGFIATSPTGVTWTSQTSNTTLTLFSGVWTGAEFVFVGALGATWASASAGVIVTSPNGTAWTQQPSNATQILVACAWDGTQTIAGGFSGAVVISPTATTVQSMVIVPGTYTVATTPTADTYTFAYTSNAVQGGTNGGFMPLFVINYPGAPTAQTVRCYFQNHGLSVSDMFTVDLTTALATNGVTIAAGDYAVTAVINAYTFEFSSGQTPSGATLERAYENAGVETVQYFFTSPTIPQNWFLDNLGENGLICPTNGPIYVYIPPVPMSGLASGEVIAGSPQINSGMFVAMPQAQIVAFGSEETIGGGVQDPLLVRWSDAGSYTTWVATATNQAGSYRLSRGSRIIGGVQGPGATYLWTDIDCWSMSYVGPPAVYSFTVAATGYGLMSPKAVVSQGSNTFWCSPKGFCVIGGNGFQEIECPLWDTFFGDLDPDQTNKIWAWSNSVYHEIWWFYPSLSGGTGEIDSYIKINTMNGLWDFGQLVRTSGTDQSVFGTPLAADENFRIQQHEVGFDADGVAMTGAFIRTGFVMIDDGTYISFVDQFRPDCKWLGSGEGALSITIISTSASGYEPDYDGPFPFTSTEGTIELRVRAREMAVQYDWVPILGTNVRIGAPQIRFAPDGRQ